MAWPTAVAGANAGGLVGGTRVGFQDNPGVTPRPGSTSSASCASASSSRTRRRSRRSSPPRSSRRDGTTIPVSMTYVDSRARRSASEPQPSRAQLTDMACRRRPARGPRRHAGRARGQRPGARARPTSRPFVRQLLGGTATAFVNTEIDEINAKLGNPADPSGPYKAYSRMGEKKYGTADDYYEIAGMNGVPVPEARHDVLRARRRRWPVRRDHRRLVDPADVLHDEHAAARRGEGGQGAVVRRDPDRERRSPTSRRRRPTWR